MVDESFKPHTSRQTLAFFLLLSMPMIVLAMAQSEFLSLGDTFGAELSKIIRRVGVGCLGVLAVWTTCRTINLKVDPVRLTYIAVFTVISLMLVATASLSFVDLLINAAFLVVFWQIVDGAKYRVATKWMMLVIIFLSTLTQSLIVLDVNEWIELQHRLVSGEPDPVTMFVPSKDCYHFIGCLNNDGAINFLGTARFQGYAYEPLHWAMYLIVGLVLSIGLWDEGPNKLTKTILLVVVGVLTFFLFAANSLAAALVMMFGIALTTVGCGMRLFLSFGMHRRHSIIFAAIGIFPLVLLPAFIIGFESLFFEIVVKNSGSDTGNWGSKLAFLKLDVGEFFRWVPLAQPYGFAGHNTLLQNQLVFGAAVTALTLLFLFQFSHHAAVDHVSLLWFAEFSLVVALILFGIHSMIVGPVGIFLVLDLIWRGSASRGEVVSRDV